MITFTSINGTISVGDLITMNAVDPWWVRLLWAMGGMRRRERHITVLRVVAMASSE